MEKNIEFMDKNLQDLNRENETLRMRLSVAEDTIEAIQNGSVDAIVVNTEVGKQVFTLTSGEYPYRDLVETMNEGAVTIAPDHTVMYCNFRFSEMLKTSGSKIIGNQIDQFIYPDDLPAFNSILSKALIEKTNGEISLSAVDGTLVAVLFSCNPFSKDTHSVWLIFTELTELKKVQDQLKRANDHLEELVKKRTEELKKSEEKANYLIKHAPTAIFEIDFRRKKFITINDAMIIMSGYSQEELLSLDVTDILDDDSKEIFQARINKMKDGEKQDEQIEYKIRTKNGRIIYVILKVKFKLDDQGVPIGAMVVGHDITERKMAENELKDSQEKLELALNAGNIGIWSWNLKTDKFYWDHRIRKMLGWENSLIAPTYKDFEAILNEDDVPHVQNEIKRAIDEGILFESIFRLKSTGDDALYINSKAKVYRDEKGTPLRMLGVCIDITEVKKNTEKVVFKLNEELMRSNKELQSFAYVASHDLQEPLRMVSSFTQLLAKQYKDKLDQNAREYIQFAVEGAGRMYDLLNGLLDYSRIQTKGNRFTSVRMMDILEHVNQNLKLAIVEKKGKITWDELPSVYADESQMIQLIQNLIVNAIKFNHNTPSVHVRCTQDNDHFIFSVCDNGIGIDEQYFDKIFQIYQRLHLREEYSGTGIGLAICKRIVERHSGKIWLESKLGKGSTFYFSLPKVKKATESSNRNISFSA